MSERAPQELYSNLLNYQLICEVQNSFHDDDSIIVDNLRSMRASLLVAGYADLSVPVYNLAEVLVQGGMDTLVADVACESLKQMYGEFKEINFDFLEALEMQFVFKMLVPKKGDSTN